MSDSPHPSNESTAQDFAIGFVGKRVLPPGSEAALRATLAQVLDQLAAENPGHALLGVSSLALGADTVFVELIAARGRPTYQQLIFLPTAPAGFFLPDDFRLGDEAATDPAVQARVARSENLLKAPAVREVRITGTSTDRDERFAETAFAIVRACDVLLVACTQADYDAALSPDPTIKLARGGSAETLRYARAGHKRAIVLLVDAPGAGARLPIRLVEA
ncbi:MAG: hypothetical protein JWP58_485 [Hymenobacter sp.]|nr:hypothetical protein [Hymenobacter sp.]